MYLSGFHAIKHAIYHSVSLQTLFPIVWEAVEDLQISGLNVIAFTSDGASANRNQMHGKGKEDACLQDLKPLS